jgi:hypothetical protein
MAQAGWYNDPTGENQLRYFDGSNWSEEVAKHPESEESDLSSFFDNQESANQGNSDFQNSSFNQNNSFTQNNSFNQNNSNPQENGFKGREDYRESFVEEEKESKSRNQRKGGLKSKILPIVMVVLLLIVVYGKISQDKTAPKPFPVTNNEVTKEANPVDKRNNEEIPVEESIAEEVYTEDEATGVRVGDEKGILDKASSNFTKKIKSTGLVVTHVNSKVTTEVTLNPNGSFYIKNPKGYGVGDSKYLYLEPNLFLAYDGETGINKLVKNRGYSWVRLNLSNTQTGITFYSGKYYDGSNIAMFWSYLKKYSSGVTSSEGSNGEREIMVDSLGGNDWATFYVDSNNNFTKVVINGDSDISTIVTVKGNGKKTAKIPSGGFIKF